MILAIKIAIIAFVFSEILTSEKMIFSFMRKLPSPFTCPYCIAGQIALLYMIFPYLWIEIIFNLSLPIGIVHFFLALNKKICQ
jgi:hypothetical protein